MTHGNRKTTLWEMNFLIISSFPLRLSSGSHVSSEGLQYFQRTKNSRAPKKDQGFFKIVCFIEVYILGHILFGPSLKHGCVKIDPFFQIWLYGKLKTRLGVHFGH